MSHSSKQIRKIDLSKYHIKQTVGTGSFGRVKVVQHKKTKKYLALKILKKSDIIKLKQVDHILSEITILNKIDSPFLVKMEGMA